MEHWSNSHFNIALAVIALALLLIPTSKIVEKGTKLWIRIVLLVAIVFVSIMGVVFTNKKEHNAEMDSLIKDSIIFTQLDKLKKLDSLNRDTVTTYKIIKGKTTMDLCFPPNITKRYPSDDSIDVVVKFCNAGKYTALNTNMQCYAILFDNFNNYGVIQFGKSYSAMDIASSENNGNATIGGTLTNKYGFSRKDCLFIFSKVNWDNKENEKIGRTPVRRIFVLKQEGYFSLITQEEQYNLVISILKDKNIW